MMKRKFGLIGATILALSTLTMGVSADTTMTKNHNVQIEVKGNTNIGGGSDNGVAGLNLEIAEMNNFNSTQINSTKEIHKTGFKKDFNVKDLRGTFAGWELTVSASQLKNKSNKTLSKGVLTLGDVSVKGAENTIVPSKILNKRTAIDNGEIRVVQADVDQGAGVFDIKFGADALELTLDPGEARVGEYESTLTWNLKSTPSAN